MGRRRRGHDYSGEVLMPIYETVCTECGNRKDYYAAREFQRQSLPLCSCRGVLMFLASLQSTPLTYFSEGGGGKWIHNLGDAPVFITSPAHHKREMEKAGVSLAPPRYGEPGCWS